MNYADKRKGGVIRVCSGVSGMLHREFKECGHGGGMMLEFLTANDTDLIAGCRVKVLQKIVPKATDAANEFLPCGSRRTRFANPSNMRLGRLWPACHPLC